MSKKIVFLLSMVMMFQSFGAGVLAANEPADTAADVVAETAVENDEYDERITAEKRKGIEEEIAVLTSAGVIELEEDYDPTAVVTRAEFAAYTAAAINAKTQMSLSYFTDVPTNHWASDSINQLTDLKVIAKSPDGMFNPDRIISYVEACKIMTVVTGYDIYARADQDMNQYVSIAGRAGFGIVPSNAKEMTIADTVKLLYRAMSVDIVLADSVIGSGYSVKPDEGKNIFSIYHQIEFDDGKVESVFGKTLNDVGVGKGEAYINGRTYYVNSSVAIDEYFGRVVNYAYKETETDVDMTVIYAEPKYSDDVIEIMYDDVESYDERSRKITYNVGTSGRETLKTKKASSNAVVVFNGRPYNKELKPKIDEFINGQRKGKIQLISSTANGEIDTIAVISYEIFGKDAYNALSRTFYADKGERTIKTDDYDRYTVYDTYKNVLDDKSMTSGPYMIAETDKKENLEIIVCTNKVDGTVESIGDGEITLSGTVYEADEQFWTDNADKFKIGMSYTLYFDIYNKIVDMSVSSADSMKNALLIKAYISEDGEGVLVRLYTADDDTLQTHELDARVNIDGVGYKSRQIKDIASAFPGDASVSGNEINVERQVIRYSATKDGKINKIDTRNVLPNEDEDTTLRRITEDVKTGYYHGGRKVLGLRGYIDTTNVKYIVVPNTNDKGEIVVKGETVADTKNKYSNKFTFEDWKSYTYELFKYSSDTVAADLIVLYSDPLVDNYTTIMYNKMNEEVDDEGSIVNMLYGYSKGGETKLTVDETVDLSDVDISRGDIIRTETDPSGKIIYSITKMYDSNAGKFEPNGSWTDPDRYWYGADYTEDNIGVYRGEHYQISSGYVIDIKNNVVSLAYTIPMAYEGTISEIFSASGIPVTIFEPSLGKNAIYTGQLSDILTYKSAGEGCDKVLVSCDKGTIKQIFVIKK